MCKTSREAKLGIWLFRTQSGGYERARSSVGVLAERGASFRDRCGGVGKKVETSASTMSTKWPRYSNRSGDGSRLQWKCIGVNLLLASIVCALPRCSD